jgi:hypothetical protein
MSFLVTDLTDLYEQTFYSKPYIINSNPQDFSQSNGSQLITKYRDKEIWLPVKFVGLDSNVFGETEILLPYATIKMESQKNVIETTLGERKGTVKELYSIDDWEIAIRGFVIDDENRRWPEAELTVLKNLNDLTESIRLDNALSNLFLGEDDRVVIMKLDLPEVSGGRKHIRPFAMTLKSDSVFDLEL